MTILTFLIVLLVLIIVHELGHFSVAKFFKIRVDEFGVGFPPKAAGIKLGETLYSINLIPFGGFVRIFGEDATKVKKGDKDYKRSMIAKSKKIQAAVLLAGVAFNVLFAWVLYAGIFTYGTPAAVTEDNQKYISNKELIVTGILPDSPVEGAGLLQGDVLTSISAGGEFIENPNAKEVSSLITSHPSESISISYKRGEEIGVVETESVLGLLEDKSLPAVGFSISEVGTLKMPFPVAVIESASFTFNMLKDVTVSIVGFLGSALILEADLSEVAGPVGIVSLVGDVSALGFVALLSFTAFISLNLAVINLLPFPALDGGRLLFLGIEAIKGSPIKPSVAQMANFVGFALLILLMFAVTYNDIARLIS